MSATSHVAIADRVITGFNQADWRQLAAIFSPDIRYVETGTNREVHGADAYMHLLQGWRLVFPNCTGTIQATVADGSMVVHQIRWEGTQAAPLPTPTGIVPNKGRKMAVTSSLWYTIRDEQVTEIHHHLDVLSMLQQLGAFEQEA
jgi:steroid delta-isomerase-like uncharacterized protein